MHGKNVNQHRFQKVLIIFFRYLCCVFTYENTKQLTLGYSICDTRARKIKKTFFDQINTLIDWENISKIINNDYSKGKSAVGKPSYDGLLLFKMCFLQSWYGLSDYEVEDCVNDSLSFSYFCGMTIEQIAPDHSTLSRFRTELTKTKTFEKLFASINNRLYAQKGRRIIK